MSVTRSSGIIATLRVMMPLTTITRLLVRMNRSKYQSNTFHATQPITAIQISTAAVTRPSMFCRVRKPARYPSRRVAPAPISSGPERWIQCRFHSPR
jgi:hypothetical protein